MMYSWIWIEFGRFIGIWRGAKGAFFKNMKMEAPGTFELSKYYKKKKWRFYVIGWRRLVFFKKKLPVKEICQSDHYLNHTNFQRKHTPNREHIKNESIKHFHLRNKRKIIKNTFEIIISKEFIFHLIFSTKYGNIMENLVYLFKQDSDFIYIFSLLPFT
jgi:hypothetical protein